MHYSKHHKSRRHQRRREPPLHHRRHWCCSFTTPPLSPENPALSHSSPCCKKTQLSSSSSHKLPLARRILSPGRVSPISDHPVTIPNTPQNQTLPKLPLLPADSEISVRDGEKLVFDVRLNLKGKNGGSLVLDVGLEVLTVNSSLFADLVTDYRRNLSGLCRIEVAEVENLIVFRETIELMFEEDIEKKLLKIGVFRAIDLLEVSASIKFGRCISACLKYLEAVPWSEEEEEKLRELLAKCDINDSKTADILDRLYTLNPVDSHPRLTKHLISSITTCTDANAGNELKPLVKGLICKSSFDEKDLPDLNKEDIYSVCVSCLKLLTTLFEEANTEPKLTRNGKDKPLLERISKQVDNINWLLDILLDHHMADEFVDLWADQEELLEMHKSASQMVRYELSRVSAAVFIAIGMRRIHCSLGTRLGFVQVWFGPMVLDFGWLRRCKRGLDVKALEGAMGQTLLTLPLKEQYSLFMEWFWCFSKHGGECPNLSKAFQIWWRRSFLRGSETFAVESR